MTSLTIQCRFIAHSYEGVRQDREGRDELDWPPAPARLHQAFIATALSNLPLSLRSEFSGATLNALRWLESLSPPDLIASRLADDSAHRRALLVAMPHNSPAKGDFARYHHDLAPVFHATPECDGPLLAAYRWTNDAPEFSRDAQIHLPALRDAVARLRYMGRAEDRVACEVHWCTNGNQEPIGQSTEIWRPTTRSEDIHLLIARTNSTDELVAEFQKAGERHAREARRPARLFLGEQRYAREAAEGILPVHVGVFQIFRDIDNPDQLPEVCDAINAHRWRSPLRACACKTAEDPTRWVNHDLATELISGHAQGGEPTRLPHLAFVPLPSLSLHGNADGRVRRFALLGYADRTNTTAASIYRTLAASLNGEEIEPGFRLQLVPEPCHDKVWSLYSRSSNCWVSVTPLALARGYAAPTHAPDGSLLSANERHLRRLAEWVALVRASLRHIHLPADIIDGCRISLTASPLLGSTERAERYRAKGESAVLIHARLEFPKPVRGPLLIGDRRYQGFGLFFPIGP